MKATITYTGSLSNFIETQLKPLLLSVGWIDLGTQTVSGITFKGLRNSIGQGFFYDTSNPSGWYCYWPTARIINNDFVPNQSLLKWNIVGSKIPSSTDNTNNPSYTNVAFDIFYNDKSWIVIDKRVANNYSYDQFYNTNYTKASFFISINNNVFFTSVNTMWANTLFYGKLNQHITVKNGVYYFNEDFSNNTPRTNLVIPKAFHKTGYFVPCNFVSDNTNLNISFPYLFIYNDVYEIRDFVYVNCNFDIDFSLSNFDFYQLFNNNSYQLTNPYIGINRNVY
jgi:hypothetical protein